MNQTRASLGLEYSDAEVRCPRKAGSIIATGRCAVMRADDEPACIAKMCPRLPPELRPAPPPPPQPVKEEPMPHPGFKCRACGQAGHTARNRNCPKRDAGDDAPSSAPAPEPKKKRAFKVVPVVEDAAAPDAVRVARKLHWAIRGAVDGHLSLAQLDAIANGDDVSAVIG